MLGLAYAFSSKTKSISICFIAVTSNLYYSKLLITAEIVTRFSDVGAMVIFCIFFSRSPQLRFASDLCL